MTDLIPFEYSDRPIRVIDIDGEPWFVVADVCAAVGIAQPTRAVTGLDDDEVSTTHVTDSAGRQQEMLVVSEPGLYSLLIRSRRPEAKPFRRWVTHEVIPSVRRTGSYALATPAPQFEIPTSLSDALRLAADQYDARIAADQRAAVAVQEREIAVAALESATPAIAYVEKYVDREDVVLIKDWAAGFNLTEPQARDLLLTKNLIYKKVVGRRYSRSQDRWVEEVEYRAKAGRCFDWFDLRPQERAPRRHNGQLRHTLYVRQMHSLDLAKRVGLEVPTPPSVLALEGPR